MAAQGKGPVVRTNIAVRHIQLRGLDEARAKRASDLWGGFISDGVYFSLLMSGRGAYDCLVQEDKADGFLHALDLPDSAWQDEDAEEEEVDAPTTRSI